MANALHRFATFLLPALLPAVLCPVAVAGVTLLGIQYRADQAFPEHDCFWDAAQYPTSCPLTNPLGGSVHVFIRNAGSSSVTIQDVVFAGFSLKQILVLHYQVEKRQPASIWLDGLTAPELQALLDAGEPVWYKTDPATIAPGGTAQIVVRLRRAPQVPSLNVDVVHSAGTTSAVVPVQPGQPRMTGSGFSSDLTKVYLYWQRAAGSGPPIAVLLDGSDVTADTTTVGDPALGVGVSVVQLNQPLSSGSMHVFKGVYGDGQEATAGLRPWNNEFIYGTWGAQDGADGDYAAAQAWIDNATNHCFNSLVVQLGSSALGDYLKTVSGRQYAADHGYGFVIDDIGKWACTNPLMWFIRDEPDAADSRVTGIPANNVVGSLAQMAVQRGEELRSAYPAAPTTLNLDMTYKPFNWYNYGQVADVTMSDPYYQARLREALWYYPARIPLYSKATFVYAVAQVARSASEPNPLHIILYSCEYVDTTTGERFPFPTPESKRIEAYYAVAGGAKGMSYWWYLPGKPSNGLGAGTPAALALWREMGLFGAEFRTAAPLLVASCPAALNIQAGTGLWARSLLVGSNTIILLVVNDQYYNDQQGCHYTPVTNASLTVDLPAWMQSPTAFEITAGGIRDVTTQVAGGQLQVTLGTVDLTRMIVVTSDTLLKGSIVQRYIEQVQPKVCSFAPEVCVPIGPIITQQPAPQTAHLGDTVFFTVAASGSGTLAYQWQKNRVDLLDGTHYEGCTTPVLTISDINYNDLGTFRCIVTNPYGTTTSNEAQLTIVPAPIPGDLDHDGDVDQDDFGHFQKCYSGRTVPQTDPDCAGCLLDQDGDVDSSDFAIFQNCLSGPDTPANPNCAG